MLCAVNVLTCSCFYQDIVPMVSNDANKQTGYCVFQSDVHHSSHCIIVSNSMHQKDRLWTPTVPTIIHGFIFGGWGRVGVEE